MNSTKLSNTLDPPAKLYRIDEWNPPTPNNSKSKIHHPLLIYKVFTILLPLFINYCSPPTIYTIIPGKINITSKSRAHLHTALYKYRSLLHRKRVYEYFRAVADEDGDSQLSSWHFLRIRGERRPRAAASPGNKCDPMHTSSSRDFRLFFFAGFQAPNLALSHIDWAREREIEKSRLVRVRYATLL